MQPSLSKIISFLNKTNYKDYQSKAMTQTWGFSTWGFSKARVWHGKPYFSNNYI